MADDKELEIAELKARLAALENRSHPGDPATPPKPTPAAGANRGGQIGCAIVLFFFALILLAMCNGAGSTSTTSTTPAADYPPPAAWTPPEGYSLYPTGRGGGVAVKWSKPTGSECTGYNVTCFAMDVVTEKGCPRSLYAAITILSKSDDNIGWTNDTAQGVEAGEKVRLVFDTYERGARSARVAEINCY